MTRFIPAQEAGPAQDARQKGWLFAIIGITAIGLFLTAWPPITGCVPEGDDRITPTPKLEDPCSGINSALQDGIQNGEDLLSVFNCANSSGNLDPLIPLMQAMNETQTHDSQGTVLDLWPIF